MGRHSLVVVCLLALAAFRASAAQAPSERPLPLRAWKLAFVRDGDIWIAHGDGSGQELLLKNAQSPAWSPDRKQIAFAREGNVWVAKADGTEQRQVTKKWKRGSSGARAPQRWSVLITWDPRLKRLTFSHDELFSITRAGEKEGDPVTGYSIFDIPVHPTERYGLETRWEFPDHAAEFNFSQSFGPAWAPDGKQLAFVRYGDIWLATRVDQGAELPEDMRWGYEVTRLAPLATYDGATYRASRENDGVTHLSWSPDGKVIAYSWQRLGGSGTEEIHLLEVATGKHWRIAQDAVDPRFSPDGTWIACTARYGKEGVWAISPDGKRHVLLAEDGEQPAW